MKLKTKCAMVMILGTLLYISLAGYTYNIQGEEITISATGNFSWIEFRYDNEWEKVVNSDDLVIHVGGLPRVRFWTIEIYNTTNVITGYLVTQPLTITVLDIPGFNLIVDSHYESVGFINDSEWFFIIMDSALYVAACIVMPIAIFRKSKRHGT